jgi:phage N-6-adenine-methyltransferase
MTYTRNDGNVCSKDEARTPPEIYNKLDAEFHFDLDVACTRDNCLSRNHYGYTKDDNALVQDWTKFMMDNGEEATIFFVNPPYSNGNILRFVHTAYCEASKGATAVLLIPADISTEYFDFCFSNASEIRFMHPRVKFNNPDGTPMKGSPQMGSMIVVFGPMGSEHTKYSIWKWKE